jgi:tRNA threonylcarbamoyl adenosine modification protein YeaZ
VLLAIDTSTSTVTAAVARGAVVVAQVTEVDHRRHGELLAPAINRALTQASATVADLTSVVVGVGPGPFTGLRVGVVTARVLAHVQGVPVHGVCSLDALAHECLSRGAVAVGAEFLVATDARRKEVYWARYVVRSGRSVRTGGPGVARAGDLPAEIRTLPCFGRGPLLYPDSLRDGGGPRDVAAGYLARFAATLCGTTAGTAPSGADPGGSLLPAEPLYLRRPDAAVPATPKSAAPISAAPDSAAPRPAALPGAGS